MPNDRFSVENDENGRWVRVSRNYQKTNRPNKITAILNVNKDIALGGCPGTWYIGYGRRLMFQTSWVQILVPYAGWTFFTFICCKKFYVCLKR